MRNTTLIIYLILSQLLNISAQPILNWASCYGGSLTDAGNCIQQTNDQGFIIAGYSRSNDGDVSGNNGQIDMWVVKIDNLGNIEWQKCLGGSEYDYATSIQQTIDGGYIVAGYSKSNDGDVTGNHGNQDFWVVKIDNLGNIEWQKCLGGSSGEVANSIQETTDQGFIVAGSTSSNDGDVTGNHGSSDSWVVKLDNLGNIEWQKCLGGSGNDVARSIDETTDGGYIIAGATISNDGDVSGNHGSMDYWVVKIDSQGNIEWQKCLGGSQFDNAKSIQQTIDGGYIVAGYSESNDGDVSGNHGGIDMWVVKLDNFGNIEWQECLGGSVEDIANSIQETIDGGFIVAGESSSNDGNVSGNHGNEDSWVVKLDSLGTIEWQKCLGGSSEDIANSIQETSISSYVLVGKTLSNDGDVSGNNGGEDYWVTKLCEQNPLTIEISDTSYCYSTELTAVGNFVEYLWNTNDTTQTITITDGGLYSVIGYTEAGCPTEEEINAPNPIEPYGLSKICMVTLEETLDKNIIIYEPDLNVGIDSVLFYRLNSLTSEFDWIGSNNINDTSIFIDQEAIPTQQNYQYKLSIRDTCSNISELSQLHRTILLQANTGVNDEINLFWNPYIGFDYPNFGIYRSVDGGEYFLIANVPNNTYTYTDLFPPFGEKKYQIRVDKDPPCNPQKNSYSFVGSNQVFFQTIDINKIEYDNILVFPNPFDDKLIIKRKLSDKTVIIELLDVFSRVMDTFILKSCETTRKISTEHLISGIYFIRINGVVEKRIVKH